MISCAHRAFLRWFLPVELLCVGGFLVCLAFGRQSLGLVFLVGPVPLLAWLAAVQNERYALLFFAALLPLAGMELLPYHFWKYLYYAATGAILLMVSRTGFIVPNDARPKRPELRDGVTLWLLAVAAVMSSASAVAHGWTGDNLSLHVVLFVEVLVLLYFFAVTPRTIDEVRRIITVFGVMLGFTVVVTFMLPAPVGEGGILGGKIVKTPFGESNLNVFGTFLSAGAVLLLGLAFETRGLGRRLFLLATVVLSLALLVLTKSRGAWFGFGVAVVYMLLRVRGAWLYAVAGMAAALMLPFAQLRHILLARAGETSVRDPSFLGRMLLMLYAWKVGSANWLLGVGFDNFRLVKHFYGYPEALVYTMKYHSHNLFVEMFVDLGIVGFVGFCWLFFGTVVRLHILSRRRDTPGWGLALGLAAAIIAYGAHGLFDFVAWQHGALALLFVLLGLGMSVVRLARKGTAQDPRIQGFKESSVGDSIP